MEKIDGDLSQCSLSWSVLQYFVQHSKTPITIDPQRIQCNVLKIVELLKIPNKIHFKGVRGPFVKDFLREIYKQRAGHLVIQLTKSFYNEISLREEQLDPTDFDALRFALHYSDGIRLDLTDAIIPLEDIGNALTLLHRVLKLRVDQKLLIKLIHASVVSNEQKKVTVSLLRALQYKLDFSGQNEIYFSAEDCRAISNAICCASDVKLKIQLTIRDCQVEESGMEELLPILHKVVFSFDKTLLKQFLSTMLHCSELELRNCASAILKAVGNELDLSHVQLDTGLCKALGLVLEQCNELSKMDFSYCQLTDERLDHLLPHLHKAQVVK
ncbi:uncharacterized protein LOC125289926 [Alosa alosa]|uniref:uncharacterized protein LOC125289926 n=1 Tax=Alosa alosa TaxID=278164 RepID=UPI00201546F4|nr:uncharacterized protein LOC125289926 [Alosa alosa]